jgi:CubicO group peptidase (beta-lactamase class C family)
MKRKFFLVILLVCSALNVFGQDFAELEQVVQAELKEKNAVGAGVAIVKGDRVVFSKGFGAANIETNAPIGGDTLFQIGSITKTFTAAMILSMAQEGKLNLDAPIGDYAKNLSPKLSRVTLNQLLSHTAGIIDEPDEFGAGDESLMASYIRSWKDDYCLFGAGEVFSYSNSGFALAGFTAQEASGKLYADLVSERIFQKLGMRSTTFRPTVAMTYPLAVGHLTKPGEKPIVVRPLPQDARLYPAGTFYTNLNDMARFAIAFLNGGQIEGKQILAPSVIEKMSAPRAKMLSAGDDTSYGYGLFMNTRRGARVVWHNGSMTGYVATMLLVPERKFAVIILGNTNNVTLDKSEEKALELNVKLEPLKDAPKAKPALPLTEAEMQKLVGVYAQPNRFKIEVFVRDGKLFIKEFNQEMPLTKIGENRFSFQFPNAKQPLEIYIEPSANGKSGFVHQYVWAFKKI